MGGGDRRCERRSVEHEQMRKCAAVEMLRYRGKVGVPVEMRARHGM